MNAKLLNNYYTGLSSSLSDVNLNSHVPGYKAGRIYAKEIRAGLTRIRIRRWFSLCYTSLMLKYILIFFHIGGDTSI